jgi:hypothetical protein
MKHIIQSSPAVAAPGRPRADRSPVIRTDGIYVLYTAFDDTLAAVRAAGAFAEPLGVPITLVHLRTVPYPLPLDRPGGASEVETDAFLARLRQECVDVRVRVYLCRDARRAIRMVFKPHSLIVVAGRRGWRPSEVKRRRQALEAAGHFVVFVDTFEGGGFASRTSSDNGHESPIAAA